MYTPIGPYFGGDNLLSERFCWLEVEVVFSGGDIVLNFTNECLKAATTVLVVIEG